MFRQSSFEQIILSLNSTITKLYGSAGISPNMERNYKKLLQFLIYHKISQKQLEVVLKLLESLKHQGNQSYNSQVYVKQLIRILVMKRQKSEINKLSLSEYPHINPLYPEIDIALQKIMNQQVQLNNENCLSCMKFLVIDQQIFDCHQPKIVLKDQDDFQQDLGKNICGLLNIGGGFLFFFTSEQNCSPYGGKQKYLNQIGKRLNEMFGYLLKQQQQQKLKDIIQLDYLPIKGQQLREYYVKPNKNQFVLRIMVRAPDISKIYHVMVPKQSSNYYVKMDKKVIKLSQQNLYMFCQKTGMLSNELNIPGKKTDFKCHPLCKEFGRIFQSKIRIANKIYIKSHKPSCKYQNSALLFIHKKKLVGKVIDFISKQMQNKKYNFEVSRPYRQHNQSPIYLFCYERLFGEILSIFSVFKEDFHLIQLHKQHNYIQIQFNIMGNKNYSKFVKKYMNQFQKKPNCKQYKKGKISNQKPVPHYFELQNLDQVLFTVICLDGFGIRSYITKQLK